MVFLKRKERHTKRKTGERRTLTALSFSFPLLQKNIYAMPYGLPAKTTLLVLCVLSCSLCYGVPLKVTDLRCNHRTNPLGIDDFKPVLSWKLTSIARGQAQTAYQVIVGLTPGDSGVWNSGKVASSQSVAVAYKGGPLNYGTRYYWQVKVWNNAGEHGNYSDPAFWEMTIDPREWKGDWISAPTVFDLQALNQHRYAMIRGAITNDYLEPMPLLRKEFSIAKPVRQARVYIAAPGFHELYLNGKKISEDVLSPAFTNYDKTVLYNVRDVTGILTRGNNAAGIMLGNGWYNSASKEVWGFDTAPWRDLAKVRFQLEVIYEDGTRESIVSDPSWKAATGPITFSQLRQGEYYDARLERPGWNEAGADTSGWQPVRRVAAPVGVLRPEALPPVKVMETFSPVDTKTLPNGNTVYDFGQNIAGFIHLRVSGKAGTRLQFKYAERLDSNGIPDQSNIDNLLADSLFQVDRYTLKGEGEETWSPRFVYHGFRYAELSIAGEAPRQLAVEAHAVHTSFEETGNFSCSDDMINKIQQSTRWSYRNNFVGFPTDCPQREKNGWTGDAQLACETGLANFDAVTSYKKWLQDLRDEQQPDGSLPGIVPTSGWGYYWGNGPAWDIACVLIPWTIYVYTGDTTVLSENYAMMKKYVDYMHSRSPGYITDFGLGDWVPVETVTPVAVTSTGYFHYGATTLSKAAQVLGKENDKTTYRDLAGKIKEAFNNKFLDPRKRTYANGSQTALSTALFHGLVPERYAADVNKNLVSAVHAKDDHIDTGILGARYIMHALTAYDRSSLAHKMITNKTYPGWGYWIEQGATTLWEDWKGEASLNHVMYGDVSSWFYKVIGGIRPDESHPGFKQFFIRPEITGDLTWANASYESVYGTIVSNWRIESGKFLHTVEVPVNTTARYYLPTGRLSDVTEEGKPLDPSRYKVVGGKGEKFIQLPAGKYELTINRWDKVMR